MDKTMKILLAIIGLGLWANVAATLVRPATVLASPQGIPDVYVRLGQVNSSLSEVASKLDDVTSNIDDETSELKDLNSTASSIESDLSRIQRGTCSNDAICK